MIRRSCLGWGRQAASPALHLNDPFRFAHRRYRQLFTDRSFDGAVTALGSLVSNAQAMEAWARERRTNKEVDLRHEMLTLLRRLELDMDRLSCLHVAGTKGKGSTCAFAESILRRGYGLRTGLFTSPHLVDVRERIRLDGKPLERDVFARYFWDTWDRLHATTQGNETPEMPAYFRFLTLMSLNVFIREEVDVALVEVGVGGRTDATNVVHPDACGISSLGYDHQKVLGDTLTEIAYEKAGIFKTGVPAYTVPQTDEAMLSLVKQAAIKKVDLSVVPPIEAWGKHCTLGLLGEFQKNNASLAVALCKQWLRNNTERLPPHIDRQELAPFLRSTGPSSSELPAGFAKGLRECRWPGRAQLLRLPTGLGNAEEKSRNRGEHELWLHLDGAHTEESMEACARWFIDSSSQDQDDADSSSDVQERRVLIFNCQQNRSASKLLTRLADTMSGGAGPGRRVSFDALIFSTFATRPGPGSDRPVVSEAADKDSRSWQQTQADAWTSLNRTDQGPTAEATVADSIPAALDSVVGLHKRWWHHDRCTSGQRGRTRVLVTGSLYLVGGVLEVLLHRNALPASALHL